MKGSRVLLSVFLILLLIGNSYAAGKWYDHYEKGLKLMKQGKWRLAIVQFKKAIAQQGEDNSHIRTYGMHFIKYFPHREMGIALYKLGRMGEAATQLDISLVQSYSERAAKYRKIIGEGVAPAKPKPLPKPPEEVTPPRPPPETPVPTPMVAPKVGERMRIAVLPFQSKGAAKDLGEIVLDKMITSLVNLKRFNVMERAELEKIIEEQKLGMTGVLDASTAAEIGKGIGLDGIILGSVTATKSSVGIDARVIDTETASIVTSKDAYSTSRNIQDIKTMVDDVVMKIYSDLPIVDGYVIKVEDEIFYIDIGSLKGMRKGMKCTIYREGEVIKHPISGEILGKKIDELGEAVTTEVFEKMACCRIVKTSGIGEIKIGDKLVTK